MTLRVFFIFPSGANESMLSPLLRKNKKPRQWRGHLISAEKEGFEPPVQSPGQRFSRPPQSTTLPFLHSCAWKSQATWAAGANIIFFCFSSRGEKIYDFSSSKNHRWSPKNGVMTGILKPLTAPDKGFLPSKALIYHKIRRFRHKKDHKNLLLN